MKRCECGGMVPSSLEHCPNCALVNARSGKKAARRALAIVAIAASSCGPPIVAAYGLPACPDAGTPNPPSYCVDHSADGGADGGSP